MNLMAKDASNAKHIEEEPAFLSRTSELSGYHAYQVRCKHYDLYVPATEQTEHFCNEPRRLNANDGGRNRDDTEEQEPVATFGRYISRVDASSEVGKTKKCTKLEERRDTRAKSGQEEVHIGDCNAYCKNDDQSRNHDDTSSCCRKWQDIIMLLENEVSHLRGKLINSNSKVKELETLVSSYKHTCSRIQQNLSLMSKGDIVNADQPKSFVKEAEIDRLKNDALSYQLLAQLCQAEYSESMKDTEKYKQQVQDLSQQLKDANLTIKEQERQLKQLADSSTIYEPRRIDLPAIEMTTRRVRSLPSSPRCVETAWYPLAPPPRPVVSCYRQPQGSTQGPPEHKYVEPEELLSMSDVISRSRNSNSNRMVLRSSVSRSLSDSSQR